MTSPRQARVRERLVAMLAIGFCLGALATTFITWRRDELGSAPVAPSASAPPSMVPGPTPDDDATPTDAEVVTTAPAIGPTTTTPDSSSPSPLVGTDLEILRRKRLRIPVDGVVNAALQPSFDQGRGGGRHEAIDILAPRGTPVRAVESGVVGKLFTSVRGGLTVYQYDPTGTFCYYYAHLDRYADGLREGQTMAAGDVVGYVGTSGNAPPNTPHLHFAIYRLTEPRTWWKGTPIDPYLVLQ